MIKVDLPQPPNLNAEYAPVNTVSYSIYDPFIKTVDCRVNIDCQSKEIP